VDHDEYRRESRARWGQAARGWAARAEFVRDASMPVSLALVDALAPQPGHRVLELAAGTGDTGFLAAELIRPGGELITSDFSPEMLTAAQERAAELGLDNVRFKQIDAESIDLDAGTLDGVVCRWGFMLMADPETALRETRRVLKPGGRVALAAWTGPEDNPWSALVGRELVRQGLGEPPDPDAPGQFTWAPSGIIEEQLASVGFVDDIRVEAVAWTYTYATAKAWFDTQVDLSSRTREVVAGLDDAALARLRDGLRAAAEPFTRDDGTVVMPARTWVASAAA
jgi:SAM-dependent methyltransferase